MVEMWSNFQSIRFVNEHVRILGRIGQLRTRMCAGGSIICTAAYSFQGLKRSREDGSFWFGPVFVAHKFYAEGSLFGAASWAIAVHTRENILGESRSTSGKPNFEGYDGYGWKVLSRLEVLVRWTTEARRRCQWEAQETTCEGKKKACRASWRC